MFSLSLLIFILTIQLFETRIIRTRRGAYMTPYSRPNYGDNQWGQNTYNPYQNQNNWEQQNTYGYNNQRSSYGRPSNYGPPPPPQPTYGPPRSSYGRPETPTYSPYSRPTSSYGRPPQFNVPQPSPVIPIVPPTVEPPVYPPIVPTVPAPEPGPLPPTDSNTAPLFGGVEPGAGALSPGGAPPTDDEMTRVEAAEKENEVRRARGGPPGINVDAIAETGTLPPQAAVPEIPMPPSK
uniref:Uncharacterized protein n=2 Tax=Caenorhabditis japonica TaxID=281687 RepID=A0A8R1DK14_CAEJA